MYAVRFYSLVGVVLLVAGCGGGDGLPRQSVSGKITLNGEPLKQGTIQFFPDDPAMEKPTSGGSPIEDGSYAISAENGLVPGKYRVSISSPSTEMSSDATPGSGANLPKDLIPADYNVASTLSADVKAGGDNTFNFELKK